MIKFVGNKLLNTAHAMLITHVSCNVFNICLECGNEEFLIYFRRKFFDNIFH